MSVIKEFKEFAIRGNAVDMAVGIIIGASFGKIVNSIVNDVVMPPIGILLGGVNFSDFAIVLKKATDKEPAVLLKYGQFINNLVDFFIVAFCVFILVKAINSMKRIGETTKK